MMSLLFETSVGERQRPAEVRGHLLWHRSKPICCSTNLPDVNVNTENPPEEPRGTLLPRCVKSPAHFYTSVSFFFRCWRSFRGQKSADVHRIKRRTLTWRCLRVWLIWSRRASLCRSQVSWPEWWDTRKRWGLEGDWSLLQNQPPRFRLEKCLLIGCPVGFSPRSFPPVEHPVN